MSRFKTVKQQKAEARAAIDVAEFNRTVPVGSLVKYYPVKGAPQSQMYFTAEEAFVFGDTVAAVRLKGKSSFVMISHCEFVSAPEVSNV